jgi:hypothetical protein
LSPQSCAQPGLLHLPRPRCHTNLNLVARKLERSVRTQAAVAAHLYVTCYTEGFSHFVTSMTAPVASGWSVRRVGLAPLESAAFSRRTQIAAVQSAQADRTSGSFPRPSLGFRVRSNSKLRQLARRPFHVEDESAPGIRVPASALGAPSCGRRIPRGPSESSSSVRPARSLVCHWRAAATIRLRRRAPIMNQRFSFPFPRRCRSQPPRSGHRRGGCPFPALCNRPP